MSDSLSALIAAVDAADSASRLTEAVQQLAEARLPGAVSSLIAALSYNNPGAAVAAVDGLIGLGTLAVPDLLNELDHHNYTARAWAIRALAGIGDPRALTTLLGAATADFAMSVRRAAARGLGNLRWTEFPLEDLDIAQAEVLDALLFVCDDEEWIVRYAAVSALESLAFAVCLSHPDWRLPLLAKLDALVAQDPVKTVRARVCLAQSRIQLRFPELTDLPSPVPHLAQDWHLILQNLYSRKSLSRPLPEGDPRRFRNLAAPFNTSPSPYRPI